MGKRDRRRSRERRRAQRAGQPVQRARPKVKIDRPPPLTFEEINTRMWNLIREASRIDAERRLQPKRFEYREGVCDINEYVDWISLVPDGR